MVIGGDIRDAFEVITGRDMVTGVELSTAARVIAVAGFFVPVVSGALLRKLATRVGIEIAEEVGERVAREVAEEVGERAAKDAFEEASVEAGERVVKEGSHVRQRASLGEIRRAAEFVKESGVDRKERRQVISAFGRETEVRVLQQDMEAWRYYGGTGKARGRWLTPQPVSYPIRELALPPGSNASRVKQWIIPRDSKVLVGPTAPRFGQPGGATQIWVPNPDILR